MARLALMRGTPGAGRPPGRSALTVSRIALGCGNFGGVGLLADERVTQIVIGPGRPEHLVPVTEALGRPLTAQERAEVGTVVS